MTVTLVTLRTRVGKTVAQKLDRLAKANERSVAAELRVAIDQHLKQADAENEAAA